MDKNNFHKFINKMNEDKRKDNPLRYLIDNENCDQFEFYINTDKVLLNKIKTPSFIGNDFIENGNNVYYIGYEFDQSVPSKLRAEFFKKLKFDKNFIDTTTKERFIKSGLTLLAQDIKSLYEINVCCIPKSRSDLNHNLIKAITAMTGARLNVIELMKEEVENIKYDFVLFLKEELDSEVNGMPRYSEKEKENQQVKINLMIENIKKSEYFSIAESVRGNKYKKYFADFLKINNEDIHKIAEEKKHVLIIDDVTTTGKTILETIKVIRSINKYVDIVIFTLVGKKIF
jgi:uncharacterized protein (DUF1697 family)